MSNVISTDKNKPTVHTPLLTKQNQPVLQTQQNQQYDALNAWEEDMKLGIDQRQLKAGDQAQAVLSQVTGKNESVGKWSRGKRRMAANTKKELQQRASAITAPVYNDPNQVNITDQQKKLESELDAFSTTKDFLAFRNDDTFLDYFNENYLELDRLCKLADSITTTEEAVFTSAKKKKEDYTEFANEVKDAKGYYDAKLKVLKSPYYTILRKSDIDAMKDQELDDRINTLEADGQTQLAEYLKASKTLREYERKGVERETEQRLDKHALKRQIKGGTSKRHKGYFEVASLKGDVGASAGAEVAGFGKVWKTEDKSSKIKNRNYEGEDTARLFQGQTETYLGADLEAHAKANIVKGSYKYVRDNFQTGANLTVGQVRTTGSVGCSMGLSFDPNEDTMVTGKVGGSLGIAADSFKTRGKIGAQLGFSDVGVKALEDVSIIGGDGKLELKGPSIAATGFAMAGKMTIETTQGTKEVSGIGVGATLDGSLLSATASGGITILGIRIGASLTGQVGVIGGSLGVAVTSGNIGCEVGFLAGLGVNLKLDVDFSQWTDLLSKKIKRFVHNKRKENKEKAQKG